MNIYLTLDNAEVMDMRNERYNVLGRQSVGLLPPPHLASVTVLFIIICLVGDSQIVF